MLRFLNVIWMLFISHSVIAQFGPLKNLSIEEESKLMEYNSKCVHRDKYSPSQRQLLYPFNQTALISLISFQDTISEFSSHLPVKKGILAAGMVKEEIRLSKAGINKLTDLLFNYGYRSKKYGVIVERMSCYDPHNAILFFNNQRKVMAYIEICFDCMGMKFSSKKINTGENCTEKFSMLKDFFISKGIKFVSIDHTDEL